MTSLNELWVGPEMDDPVASVSGGTQQELNLALGVASDPDLLLLDEPYQGFDRRSYDAFIAMLDHWRDEQRAVVIVTHMIDDPAPYDQVIVLGEWGRDVRSSHIWAVARAGIRELGTLLGVVTSRDLESTIALIGLIGIDVSLTTNDRLGSVLPLRGPIKPLRYGSGSQVHDLGAIVPAAVWTVALVAMVAVAYHRRWRLHATAAPIDHEMGRRT